MRKCGFVSRSCFMLCWVFVLGLVTLDPPGKNHRVWGSEAAPAITADEAQKWLQEGNQRFIERQRAYSHLSLDRLVEVAKGQHPFVTILSCSDSRVPPEHLFDVGLGDIFVIRIAGNVCDIDETGTIEYGVEHLKIPLLVVLGHTGCGAVTAVVNHAELPGKIPQLVDNIIPAVEAARKAHPDLKGDALVTEAVRANIWQAIRDAFKSKIVLESVKEKKLRVVGALYHIEDGKVEWLGPHPQEKKLLGEPASAKVSVPQLKQPEKKPSAPVKKEK